MQIVMWVIFGGTLGLANLITYQRTHTQIELDDPVRIGSLRARPPQDWTLTTHSDPGKGILQWMDPDRTRQLTITVTRLPSGAELSASPQGDVRSRGTEPLEFQGLRQKGLMTVMAIPGNPEEGSLPLDVLMALTVLPSGEMVKIQLLQGHSRIGAADRMLVQAVANGITRPGRGEPPSRPPQIEAPPSDDD